MWEMKCRFRGLADHSHVKQVHVECKANKETAPARGPARGGGGGTEAKHRRRGGGGDPEAKHRRRGGVVTRRRNTDSPPWDCLGRLMGNSQKSSNTTLRFCPSRKAKTMKKPTFFDIAKMKFSAAEGPKTL